MNTMSASPAEPATGESARRKILVWDAPVRVFHWLMVASFAGAWLTAESERWRLMHVTLGYTMAGLVAFRILWGLFGTRHARFASFVRGPAAVANYLRSIVRGRPEHYTGHNPAGALAIVVLLLLAIAITASGWATYNEIGGKWLEEIHEAGASIMLAVVIAHIVGAIVSSWLHRENLIGAMISGRKPGRPEEAARGAWRPLAALLLAVVLGFWWTQFKGAPGRGGEANAVSMAPAPSTIVTKAAKPTRHKHGDD